MSNHHLKLVWTAVIQLAYISVDIFLYKPPAVILVHVKTYLA